ncbi:MAG TPA: 50S ribosomal protein L22 [Firmicutes bacterium]|nr:50S ribosomal protein L22 [Bacillota bacterium]HBN00996.1 50S ribosomal protein L22 [Bacillota bacterium]
MAEEKKTVKKAPAKKAAAPKAKKETKAKKAEVKAEEVKTEEAKVEKTEKKAKKVVKAEPVKAEPVKEEKPAVTEALAIARDVRVTPRKIRLVLDLVRGKDVDEALAILKNVNRSASLPVAKIVKSAAANATNNFGMDKDKLYIAEIQASDGIKMKRFMPRGKGSSSGLVKRTSNIRCIVKERN